MNGLLLQNRPKDIDAEQFKALWENSSYTLEPFYKTILTFVAKDQVVASDFDCPNHYEKMVWQAAQRDLLNKIIDLLPKKLTMP